MNNSKVADFDFQQRELLNEKTFFERVRDSFSASFKAPLSASRLISSRGTSYDNFIDDVDSPDPEFGEPRLSINAWEFQFRHLKSDIWALYSTTRLH